jgi:hypothetical protein
MLGSIASVTILLGWLSSSGYGTIRFLLLLLGQHVRGVEV